GYDGVMRLEPLCVYRSPGGSFSYHNFLTIVPDEYTPWDSHENEDAQWFEMGDWPTPLHFGLKHLISEPLAMRRIADFVAQAKAGVDLMQAATQPERTLYHCLYKQPEGDALLPLSERHENGRTDKFLYATHSLSKALAYTFAYHGQGEIACNGSLQGTPDEFAVICDRDKTMNAARHIRVFSFSSNGFEPAGDASTTRQWVSTKKMPFADTTLCFETRDLNEVMRNGLQIFSYAGSIDDLYGPNGLLNGYSQKASSNVDFLVRMVKDGVLRWENMAPTPDGRSRHPTPQVQAAMTAAGVVFGSQGQVLRGGPTPAP
ncbi:MAG: hypothetical protein KKA05_04150, partial [Alphaproteobacteria bacterium]|nr:hypothetical protein [Alphaproteobacteria bacterium]